MIEVTIRNLGTTVLVQQHRDTVDVKVLGHIPNQDKTMELVKEAIKLCPFGPEAEGSFVSALIAQVIAARLDYSVVRHL